MMEGLNAEWVSYMNVYRIFSPKDPQQTIAYEEDLGMAKKRAIENGYSSLTLCDTDSMHLERY